jgi:Tfp pilus assembly protein PilP
MTRALLWTLPLVLLAGCGDSPEKGSGGPPPPPPGGGRPAAPPPGSPVAAAAAQPGVEQSKEALLAEVRKRQLTSDDFKESPSNRDPFRSFLTTFATQVINVKPQHRILLEKFALEELKLIAIVGGNGETPKAMFVDPTGMGVTVVRGDHVSKVDALVTRVAPDRVFFQLEEDVGNGGKPKLSERVVELHAGENIGAGQ